MAEKSARPSGSLLNKPQEFHRLPMPVRLIIAGASVRAAAQSAVRSGFLVTAADLFCDRDLAECSRAHHVADYPRGILELTRRIPPAEWMYTGGLENEPDLVDAISQRHALLGHAGCVLLQLRDPWQLARVLSRQQLQFPQPQRQSPAIGVGRWVLKPQRSCGGLRIRWYDPLTPTLLSAAEPGERGQEVGHAAPTAPKILNGARCPRDWYYQPWIRGMSVSAVFLAAGGSAVLLGVTRQLVGCRWAGATGFRYVGSIGPLEIDRGLRRQFQRIGACLADAFDMCGLFGIDAIVSGTDVWTIEVNPRLTASVEILERATGLAAIAMHRDVCHGASLPAPNAGHGGHWHGKAVISAALDCVVDAAFYQRLETFPPLDRFERFADLPPIGARIRAGQPVLTCFAHGQSPGAVHRELRSQARIIGQLLDARGRLEDSSQPASSSSAAAKQESCGQQMA
jgi:predicted ATP-grasp superfamily ATP-dependent carboligase